MRFGGLVGIILRMKVLWTLVILVGWSVGLASGDEVLVGREYFPAVREAIAGAETSVVVQMYFIIERPDRPDGPMGTLVKELIAAHRRGVDVQVLLEDSKRGENAVAYHALSAAGVPVSFDSAGALLHSKAVVIDGRICIVGSTNWSRAALEDNHEVSLMIESAADAAELTAAFEAIPRQAGVPVSVQQSDGVRIPTALLGAGQPLSRMVTDRAECAFDMYLRLLWLSQDAESPTLSYDSGDIREYVDCWILWSIGVLE